MNTSQVLTRLADEVEPLYLTGRDASTAVVPSLQPTFEGKWRVYAGCVSETGGYLRGSWLMAA